MAAQRITVFAPGSGNTVRSPLLAYSRLAVERRDAEVRVVSWHIPADFDGSMKQRFDMVLSQAAARPPLLIGGDVDPVWDGAVARRISPYVLEIPGADHELYIPGPVSATAAVAGRVADAVEDFLDTQVWPR